MTTIDDLTNKDENKKEIRLEDNKDVPFPDEEDDFSIWDLLSLRRPHIFKGFFHRKPKNIYTQEDYKRNKEMKELTTTIDEIAHFCGICDNYINDETKKCKILSPLQQVFRIYYNHSCKSASIKGHNAEVSNDSVSIDKKGYPRQNIQDWIKEL